MRAEHFVCMPCFRALEEKESAVLKEHLFSPPADGREGEGEGGEGEGGGERGFCVIL